MSNKRFSERLNKELDSIGLPESTSERIDALAKMLKVSKFKAGALLSGNTHIDKTVLTALAEELEVNADWLIGKNDDKSRAH